MNALLAIALTLSATAPCPPLSPEYKPHASRHYIGVLSAPSFFVAGRCDPNYPTVDVYAGPSSKRRIAQLGWQRGGQPDSWWCMPVVYDIDAECPRSDLPVMEYGYEEPGFIVLEEKGNWARIRLDKGTGWIRKEKTPTLHYYEDLVYLIPQLAPEWDGRLYRTPGGKSSKPQGTTDRSVEVLDCRVAGGVLWFKVRLLDHSVCGAAGEPKTIATGWLPAYSADGDPLVHYSPRGC